MDTRLYHTNMVIDLDVVGTPDVRIMLDSQQIYAGIVTSSQPIRHVWDSVAGNCVLMIEHCNKKSDDADTALIINSIEFNGISSPNFVWQGVYEPQYPEPWASQQHLAGNSLESQLTATQHLGWNGRWTLTFTVPIFTWIHQVEDLGWIHQ